MHCVDNVPVSMNTMTLYFLLHYTQYSGSNTLSSLWFPYVYNEKQKRDFNNLECENITAVFTRIMYSSTVNTDFERMRSCESQLVVTVHDCQPGPGASGQFHKPYLDYAFT